MNNLQSRTLVGRFGWAVILVLALAILGCDGPAEEETTASEEATSEAAEADEHAEHDKYAGWCHGHALPEEYCTKCHPELVDKYKEEGDWCDEHEFPESACPECNPMDPPEG